MSPARALAVAEWCSGRVMQIFRVLPVHWLPLLHNTGLLASKFPSRLLSSFSSAYVKLGEVFFLPDCSVNLSKKISKRDIAHCFNWNNFFPDVHQVSQLQVGTTKLQRRKRRREKVKKIIARPRCSKSPAKQKSTLKIWKKLDRLENERWHINRYFCIDVVLVFETSRPKAVYIYVYTCL